MAEPAQPTAAERPRPGPVRLVATVSVEAPVVEEAVARARAMLAVAPEVLTAEVGPCRDVVTGEAVPGDYVISATFPDHEALRRYATSDVHDEVLAWVTPHRVGEHVTVFEADTVDR